MLRGLWKRVSRFREYETGLTRTNRERQGVESLCDAWKRLNALAEQIWKIAQDETFSEGCTRQSLNDYKLNLIKTYHDWNEAFLDHLELSTAEDDRFFLNSAETLRRFWGVCQSLNAVEQNESPNLEYSKAEILSELAGYLTENDLDDLQRDRPPQPISPNIIDYSERTHKWMGMPAVTKE